MPLCHEKIHSRHAPTTTTAITKSAVGKIMSATTTLPSLWWLGHKSMPKIPTFGVKALFDYAKERAILAISVRLKAR
jgi:hypothetical protein